MRESIYCPWVSGWPWEGQSLQGQQDPKMSKHQKNYGNYEGMINTPMSYNTLDKSNKYNDRIYIYKYLFKIYEIFKI